MLQLNSLPFEINTKVMLSVSSFILKDTELKSDKKEFLAKFYKKNVDPIFGKNLEYQNDFDLLMGMSKDFEPEKVSRNIEQFL